MEELRALIVRPPFVDWIVDGKKTWELRGSATKVRGPIALIAGGTGTVVGTCDLVDAVGPLKSRELQANARKLNVSPSAFEGPLYYARTYAWVLTNARRLPKPVPYDHPSGAVIWVKLNADLRRAVGL